MITVDSTTRAPRHTWVPAVGALAGLALTVKAALIFATANTVGEAPAAALYLGGLALGLAAAVGLGLRRHKRVWRVVVSLLAALLLVWWIVGLGEILNPVARLVSSAAYVGDELPIGVAGVALLLMSFVGYRADLARRAASDSFAQG